MADYIPSSLELQEQTWLSGAWTDIKNMKPEKA
jgi:hypothetical protein